MSKLMNYRVVRGHEGDRAYAEGDTRTAEEHVVKHLVPHVLEPIGPAEDPQPEPAAKASEPAKNKREQPAANKADPKE